MKSAFGELSQISKSGDYIVECFASMSRIWEVRDARKSFTVTRLSSMSDDAMRFYWNSLIMAFKGCY
jgi:hypothetical protein